MYSFTSAPAILLIDTASDEGSVPFGFSFLFSTQTSIKQMRSLFLVHVSSLRTLRDAVCPPQRNKSSDQTEDPKSREKFQAVSDAYAILGDDRKRREYDRSLKRPAPPPTPTPTTSPTPSSTTSRHRPARPHPHVWEVHRSGKYTYYRPPPGQQTSYTWSRTDPFTSPHVQRATGKSAMPGGAHPRPMEGKARPGPFAGMGTGAGKDAGTGSGSGTAGAPHQQRTETESDRVGRESSVFRVIQVIGIVMVIATIGNGFSVSASW
ncbi:hypothetical protein SERLADRAFT_412725 [Serpula lacrymans var. lacrymans S7.9]|uniref:Uncharacterized protein n=1 Tax=Serpula lacrymans var. lacrymans (strain S7.9) TaxID=578457 RepID=F8NGE6_SERL9|nr:uncharacterized protein SERLADRAFT_412725 [Serpula lacrymans var. lacrymans S7.9]EGO29081.1 hypothetical protein SERLADRAFT_412725 [Serpula lacrymans var. lacrymans S7.9]